jgi:transcriptional regulator with XRE-family HTH domain
MAIAEKKNIGAPGDKKKGRATSIDEHVGHQLRQRRALMGMTQEHLADAVGITFQQVQKYENGANRVSAGRLFEFSKILDVPVNFFFENFGLGATASKSYYNLGMAENDQAAFEGPSDVMTKKETIELIRTYYSIQDPKLRKNLFNFVKSMAESLKEQDGKAS